jgi:hypothetical protein
MFSACIAAQYALLYGYVYSAVGCIVLYHFLHSPFARGGQREVLPNCK